MDTLIDRTDVLGGEQRAGSRRGVGMARFAVIGLGRFGQVLAMQLARQHAEVLAIDESIELVNAHRDEVTLAVSMDSTNEEALRAHGVHKMDAVIVAIGDDFEASCLTVSILKSMNPDLRVYARATTEVRGKVLKRIGADTVIFPEAEAGVRLARALAHPGMLDADELAPGIMEARLRTPADFVGKTVLELNLRQRYSVNLVAIKRPGSRTPIVIPRPDSKIEPADELLLIGDREQIEFLSRQPKDV